MNHFFVISAKLKLYTQDVEYFSFSGTWDFKCNEEGQLNRPYSIGIFIHFSHGPLLFARYERQFCPVVTGRVEDKQLLNEIQTISNVKYLGVKIFRTQVNDLDAYALNKYVMGKKLFEAMMCDVPVVTNVATEIS